MQQQQTLPREWVDYIFGSLGLTYGRDFLGRWAGLNEDAIKDDWAVRLGGFSNSTDCLVYALEHLPAAKPPTVLEFRDLCRKAPQAAVLALPAPSADPELAKAVRTAVKPAGAVSGVPPLKWAYDLKRREEGQNAETPDRARLTPFQRAAWREALGVREELKEAA